LHASSLLGLPWLASRNRRCRWYRPSMHSNYRQLRGWTNRCNVIGDRSQCALEFLECVIRKRDLYRAIKIGKYWSENCFSLLREDTSKKRNNHLVGSQNVISRVTLVSNRKFAIDGDSKITDRWNVVPERNFRENRIVDCPSCQPVNSFYLIAVTENSTYLFYRWRKKSRIFSFLLVYYICTFACSVYGRIDVSRVYRHISVLW